MIRYALRCEDGHDFESWFANADAYDTLVSKGHLTCAVCGGGGVRKGLMAPKVSTDVPAGMADALAAIRRKVESEATYVGDGFAAEARAQHLGDKPARAIYGEATAPQAKSLLEDGVPIAPLPFRPKAKSN